MRARAYEGGVAMGVVLRIGGHQGLTPNQLTLFLNRSHHSLLVHILETLVHRAGICNLQRMSGIAQCHRTGQESRPF